jgi:hypothetical protein
MRYELWAVEVEVCSNPLTYELEYRRDEHGQGSPLTWTSREDAEAYIDSLKREFDHQEADLDILKVVPLTGEADSENEEPSGFLTEPERAGSLLGSSAAVAAADYIEGVKDRLFN